jgi:hypothetical protein
MVPDLVRRDAESLRRDLDHLCRACGRQSLSAIFENLVWHTKSVHQTVTVTGIDQPLVLHSNDPVPHTNNVPPLADLGVEPLAHLGAAVADEHTPVHVRNHQRSGLQTGGEGMAQTGGGEPCSPPS